MPTVREKLQQIVSHTFLAQAEYYEELGSTNDLARQYVQEGAERWLPLLILADRQTAGRGRGSNRWWTGSGSLAFSLLLPPEEKGSGSFCLEGPSGAPHKRVLTPFPPPSMTGLAAAVAIVETVQPLLADDNASVHWPNDVYVGERKLAGILIEVLADRHRVVGIGLNTNNSTADAPRELRRKIVTLRDLLGRPVDRIEILTAIMHRLQEQLEMLSCSPEKVARRANQLCGQSGQLLTLKTATQTTSGRCLGIADDGGLLLETDAGQKTFYTGTLH